MTLIAWPAESCRSRAIRERSSATASRRSCSARQARVSSCSMRVRRSRVRSPANQPVASASPPWNISLAGITSCSNAVRAARRRKAEDGRGAAPGERLGGGELVEGDRGPDRDAGPVAERDQQHRGERGHRERGQRRAASDRHRQRRGRRQQDADGVDGPQRRRDRQAGREQQERGGERERREGGVDQRAGRVLHGLASVPARGAPVIPPREDRSPRNVETQVPLRGCFAAARAAIACRGVTLHLIVLAVVALLALAVYLIRRR